MDLGRVVLGCSLSENARKVCLVSTVYVIIACSYFAGFRFRFAGGLSEAAPMSVNHTGVRNDVVEDELTDEASWYLNACLEVSCEVDPFIVIE